MTDPEPVSENRQGGAMYPLPALLDAAENALRVSHFATHNLTWVDAASTAAQAKALLDRLGFDVAPVRSVSGRPGRYVARDRIGNDADVPVLDCTQVLDAAHLVTGDLGLADGVRALRDQPFFFVLEGQRLAGIFTWSDLQKAPVSMVLLALVLAGEAALNPLIRRVYGDDWESALSPNRLRQIEEVWQVRLKTNTDTTRLDCLMLTDRLTLLRRSESLRASFGFGTKRELDNWRARFLRLRDVLAHGGDVLQVEQDVRRAVDLFDETRAFSELGWALEGGGEGTSSSALVARLRDHFRSLRAALR